MGSIFILIGFLGAALLGFFVLVRPSGKRYTPKKLVPGQKMTNRKGKHYIVNNTGALEDYFFDKPEVKKQLNAFHGLYMQQTLSALYKGEEPPNSVGGYGVLTKKKLKSVWNDDWQAELDKMSTYYDVTYNSFFGIADDHPPVTILLTADEIVEQYGSEKES